MEEKNKYEGVPEQIMVHLTSMYFMGIQSGIQSYHCGMEYYCKHGETPEFQAWVRRDKTVWIYNGWDTNNTTINYYNPKEVYTGRLQKDMRELQEAGILFAEFYEPGANNAMSSIGFLVDERVFDREAYPDAPYVYLTQEEYLQRDSETEKKKQYEANVGLYGEKTAFLREFIKGRQRAT